MMDKLDVHCLNNLDLFDLGWITEIGNCYIIWYLSSSVLMDVHQVTVQDHIYPIVYHENRKDEDPSVELAKKRLVAIILAWGTEAGRQEHSCLTGWLKREMLVLVCIPITAHLLDCEDYSKCWMKWPPELTSLPVQKLFIRPWLRTLMRLYVMLVHSISLQDILMIK